jgi:hypothetical protein
MSSSPTFSFATTAEEVATAFAEEIRGNNGISWHILLAMTLNILIVLITGTSLNGIGFETALAIARHANLVTITGYNADRSVVLFTRDAIHSSTQFSASSSPRTPSRRRCRLPISDASFSTCRLSLRFVRPPRWSTQTQSRCT